MMKVFTKTEDELFNEIVERGRDMTVHTKEEYDSVVEDILNDEVDLGEVDVDDDTEGYEEHLKARFDEYQTRVAAE